MVRRFLPKTLKAQLLFYGTLSVLIAGTLVGWLDFRTADADARRGVQEHMLEVSTALVSALERVGLQQGQEILDAFQRDYGANEGSEASIVDPQGRIIAASRHASIGKSVEQAMGHPEPEVAQVLAGQLPQAQTEMTHHGVPVFDLTLPLHGDPTDPARVTGALHYAEPYTAYTELLQQSLLRLLLSELLLVVLLIVPFWLFLERRILRPVQRIVEANRALAQGRRAGTTLPEWTQPFGIQKLLAVPLVSHDRAIGLMELDHTEAQRAFTPEQIDLALTIGGQVAASIENARLYTEIQQELVERKRVEETLCRRDAILESISFAAERFLKITAWEENIQEVLERLGQATGVSRVYIFENHAERGDAEPGDVVTTQRYEWVAPGIPPQIDNPELQSFPLRAGGFARWEETLGKGDLIYGHVREFPASERAVLAEQDIQSIAVVPIFLGQTWWGFIGFDECRAEREWSVTERDVLKTAADTLGAALQRQQVEAELQTYARQQAALFNLSADLAAVLDETDVCQKVVRGLHDTMGYDHVGLFLVDQTTGERVLPEGASTGWPDAPPHWRISPGQGVSEYALLSGQLHYTPDVTRDPRYVRGLGSGAEVDVPIHIGGRVVGVLIVESKQPRAFGPPDFAVLTAAANQTSLALQRAREHHAVKEAEAHYHRLFNTVPVGIYQTAPGSGWLTANPMLAQTLGYESPEELMAAVTDLDHQFYVQRDRRAEFVRRLEEHDAVREFESEVYCKDGRVIWISENARSVRDASGKVVGFEGTALDITERKRAEQEIQRRANEFAALYETARDFAAQSDLPALLQTIVQRAVTLLAASGGGMCLYDAERGDLEYSVTTDPSIPIGTRLQMGEGMAGRVAQSRQPLIVDDYHTWPQRSPKYEGIPFTAVVQVPMLYRGELIGVLAVNEVGATTKGASATRKFTEEEARLLSLFAGQAASAVHDARLFEEARQRAIAMTTLQETALDLVSHLETEPLLETIIRRATDLLGGTGGVIYQWEESTQQLRCTISHDLSRDYMNVTLQPGEGMAGRVYQTAQPLVVNDYAHWDGRAAHLRDIPSRAVICVPIPWQGRVIGTINVNDESGARTFDDRDVRLLGLFANQAAIAIENARLYAAVQQELAERARYEFIVNTSHELMTLINQDRQLEAANAAYCQAHHKTREGVLGKTVAEVWGEAVYQPNIKPHLDRCLAGHIERYQEWFPFADAEPRCFDVTYYPYSGRAGAVTHAVVVSHDITERKQAEEKLAATVTELERHSREITLLNEMGDLLQACHTVEEASTVVAQFAQQLFPNQSGALCLIAPSRDFVEALTTWGESPPQDRVFTPDDCWALRRGQAHLVTDPGSVLLCRHVSQSLSAGYMCVPMMAHGETLGILHLQGAKPGLSPTQEEPEILLASQQQLAVTLAEHIALALANLKLRSALRNQAIRDPLTGLFNRRYMEETLERELHRAERRQLPLGIILFDLDHFKKFNDTFGHPAGDVVLREIGAFLQTSVRAEDIACRYGGEEFVVILPEASLDDTLKRAEQLREGIKGLSVRYHEQPLGVVTVSLGVAVLPDHGATAEVILKAADAALYRAKRGAAIGWPSRRAKRRSGAVSVPAVVTGC